MTPDRERPPVGEPGAVTSDHVSGGIEEIVPHGCSDGPQPGSARDAYQTMREDEHGIFHVTVHHDDWCPWWVERRKR